MTLSDNRSKVVLDSGPMAKTALFLGLLGSSAGHAFLLAALPPLGREMGWSVLQTGALLSLGALGLLFAAPLWGFLAERWGRRPVLMIGLTAAFLAPGLFGLVVYGRLAGLLSALASFLILIIIRLLQSLLTGGLFPAAQAFIADVTAPSRRTGGMGMMAAAFGLGGIVGATILWLTSHFGAPIGFGIVAAFSAIGALFCWQYLSEPVSRLVAAKQAEGSQIAWHKVWPHLVITMFGVTAYGIVQHITGLRLQDLLNLTTAEATGRTGAALTATALTMVLAQAVVLQRLRWPPRDLLWTGAGLGILALMGLILIQNFLGIVFAMMMLGLALGLLLPANLAALSLATSTHAQGRIAGINAIGQGLGLVLGPITGAAAYQALPTMPYGIAALLLAVVGVLTALAARGRRHNNG